jgi:GT2 family glycosyltransferase
VSSAGPRIVAVLVTHDGRPGLRRALTALAAQTQPGIEVFAVDNASEDGTAELLVDLLGPERVLVSDRDLGFPAGVDLALDAVDAADARLGRSGPGEDDLLLLLHDDLELERDAVEQLVQALIDDDRVAIVGPKLRWADDPERLQSVGATIDLTGRVDDGIDPGELDQGQRDGDRRVLFVPTAGMLLRRRVFDELGRFDRRAYAFREDLDLCWRAGVAGHDVEVVPGAVARHSALAAEHLRTGRVAELGPRYLAERNTLSALLTNYGPIRVALVVPLALVVGLAKVAGFLLTRRIGDARETVAAWGWNLVNLRGTLRRRRRVQAMRRRSDAELAHLFGRVMPRLQAYLEAIVERLAGDPAPDDLGSAETHPSALLQGELRDRVRTYEDLDTDDDRALAILAMDATVDQGVAAGLRRRLTLQPVRTLLIPVTMLLIVGLRAVLLPGAVRGGDLLPFPTGPGLVARYLGGWQDSGATLSALDPSPAQFMLGVLQWLGGGAALRALFLLAPLLAWVAAMRALAPYLRAELPRTVLALVYALSPPLLVALASGDIVTLVVAVTLPVLVSLGRTVLDRTSPVEWVWRSIALASLTAAITIAFAPPLVLGLPVLLLAGVGHAAAAVEDARWRRTLIVRSIALATLPLPLLGPWLLALPDVLRLEFTRGTPGLGGHPVAWLALDPSGRLLGAAGAALVLAGVAGAIVVAFTKVSTTTFRAAVGMMMLGVGLPLLAWWLDAAGTAMRPGPLLIVAIVALVGLVALGVAQAPAVLARYAFGWRQVALASLSVAAVAFAFLGLARFAVTGTPGLSREGAIPAYLATLSPQPPDRVLVIGASEVGVVWEVVPATGPDLGAFGVRHEPVTMDALESAVADLLAGTDPRAAARLGRLGIGIVVVPDGFEDAQLVALLRVQAALDPLPTLTGSVARVIGGVPGAAIVRDTASTDRVPDPTVPPRTIVTGLARVAPDRFAGTSGAGGELVAAVPFGVGWRVLVNGAPVPLLSDEGLLRVLDVPTGVDVEVVAGANATRTGLLRMQALWALLLASLGLRPPGFAVRGARSEQTAGSGSAPEPESEALSEPERVTK